MPFKPFNGTPSLRGVGVEWNETEAWLPPADLDVFYRPDVLIIALYAAVLTASLAANTLLIFIVIKFQYMRSVTNIFLVNLSVADLLVTLFCMPVQIAKSVTLLWYFGEVMCKTVNFLQGVAVASSVFTITAMSVDRYLAITQSLRQPWMPSRRGACSLLVALWLVALAIFAPLLAVAAVERETIPMLSRNQNGSVWVERGIEFCTEKWPDSIKKELFGAFSFILVYAVPGCIVVVSYFLMGRRLCSVLPPFDQTEGSVNSQQRLRLVRERKRVAWILFLLALAVLFALCWLPYNILQLLIMCIPFQRLRLVRERKREAWILLLLAVLFALCWLPYNTLQLLIMCIPFQRLRLVRERKRVAWILLLLAVLFALCWLPYNILQLLIDVNAVQVEAVALLLPYTLLLGHANSAINPIVYCLMTRNFRRSLRKLLCHDPGNLHSSTHFNMQGIRQKSNTSSMRTCTTVTFRSSQRSTLRAGPSIHYGRVNRAPSSDVTWRDGSRAKNPQFV